MVGAAYAHRNPSGRRAGEHPVCDAEFIATDPVARVPIVNVGDTAESAGQPFTHLRLAVEAPPPWVRPAGHIERTVVREVGHDRVEIMPVEGVEQLLLQWNTNLSTGNNLVQLMNTEVHQTLLDASVPNPSRETLASDQAAVASLASRYEAILASFVQAGLLSTHPDEVSLLSEANHGGEVAQQQTLTSSALRTWHVYRSAQQAVMQDIAAVDPDGANVLERAQGEPTNADTLSALRTLIQFDGRIASSVHDVAAVEQQYQLISALVAAVLAFLAIGVVGWVISNTLVRRLLALQSVTQAVEQGQMETRVQVAGRDEIAEVSDSVNGMLDTIVGLLDVAQRQRDALVAAAERLFSDVRIAGSGDLRVNASVSSDPVRSARVPMAGSGAPRPGDAVWRLRARRWIVLDHRRD